ncbi:MAG: type II secretion system F family protein [Candidatus Jordarchaeum sp.]|uniref:type II secretion system F family protein n=1 Tax=Candidatus Jordarchaeum sp. TaxID=2823881 RepID=UPI00404A0F5B
MERISKTFGSNRSLRKIGKRIITRELIISVNHFFKEGQITAEEVSGGALGFGLSIAFLTLIMGIMFNILVAVMLSVAMFIFGYNYVITYYPKKYDKNRWTIARYADFILEELLFILLSTGSIFDFILFVANADYPIISQEFKSLANHVNSGEKPEKLLLNFSYNQPTETLKIHIPAILKSSEISDELVDRIVRIAQREVRNEYQRYTLELEGRLLVVMGIGFFLPIVISLGLLMNNIGTNPLFLILIPLQIMILVILDKFAIRSKAKLLEMSEKPKHTYNDFPKRH